MLNREIAAKKQIVGVLVDIGNSETRVRVKYKPLTGLEGIHNPVEQTFALSNHYMNPPINYLIPTDYQNSGTTVLDVDAVRILHGDVVEREFIGQYVYPSGKRDKSEEPITKWTMERVFLEVIKILAKAWDMPTTDIDVAFKVFCLLPPDEHEYNRNAMINLIASINTVTECVPVGDEVSYKPVTYNILCEDIQTSPEGIAAFFGIRCNIVANKLVADPTMAKYMKGYCLIVDVGAGTTDLAIMQDGKLMANSRRTIFDAGNRIISSLQYNIKANSNLRNRMKLGITNINSVMTQAMIIEGDGVITEPCEKELDAAKEDLANVLSKQIRDYVNTCDIMPLLKGVLIIGGANIAAVRDGEVVSPALSTFLMPKIKSYSAGAELIDIGNRDPRYLNIDGLEAIYITQLSHNAKLAKAQVAAAKAETAKIQANETPTDDSTGTDESAKVAS